MYLYLIFMMSPHIAKLLLHKIKKNHKLSQTVHEKFRPIVHEKKMFNKMANFNR